MVRNKILSNLVSLSQGEVVTNSNDSDWSCKRCLGLAFSLNGDGDDELKGISRRGRATRNDSYPAGRLLGESFNLLLSLGGEVGACCLLLESAAGVMKDSGGNVDGVILVLAGEMKSSHEVVDTMNLSLLLNIHLKSYLQLGENMEIWEAFGACKIENATLNVVSLLRG